MFETEKPRRKPGSMCPQFRQDVSEVCHNCEWYQNLRGKHPQTSETIDQWGCSVTFSALVGVGIIQAVNSNVGGLQAATESFRNEVVNANQTAIQVIAATALHRPNGHAPRMIEQQDG